MPRRILVIGAGKSAAYLLHYLLEQAQAEDLEVTVSGTRLRVKGKREAAEAKKREEQKNATRPRKNAWPSTSANRFPPHPSPGT